MRNSVITVLCLLILAVSCRKVGFDPPVNEDPVFTIAATVDDEPFEAKAGVDNYYMFTDWSVDAHSVHSFSGVLKEESCQDSCGKEISITIRDFRVAASNDVDVATALQPGQYEYLGAILPAQPEIKVEFFSNPDGTSPFSYEWNFGDGFTSRLKNPIHIYRSEDEFAVRLTTTDATGCTSVQERMVITTGDTLQCALVLSPPIYNGLDSQSQNPVYCVVPLPVSGIPPFTFYQGADMQDPVDSMFCFSNFNQTPICITMIDAAGCTSENCIQISVSGSNPSGANYCSTQFTYVSERISTPGPDTLQLSKVVVGFKDENGISYSSENVAQPTASFFEIIESENFLVNEKGQDTRKLKLRFTALVADEGGNTRLIENASAVMAVAHP